MGHMVSLAMAIRLLGIRRSELQRMIHDGALAAPDGMVDMERLRELFPALALNDAPVFERVQLIKTTAFSRRVRSTITPDHDALEIQLKKRNAELSLERALVKKYRTLLDDMTRQLQTMQQDGNLDRRRVAAELNRWLLRKLEQ